MTCTDSKRIHHACIHPCSPSTRNRACGILWREHRVDAAALTCGEPTRSDGDGRSLLTSGLKNIGPLFTQTIDALAATWFPSPQALDEFAAMHTAVGSDHWRIVIGRTSSDCLAMLMPKIFRIRKRLRGSRPRSCSSTAIEITTSPRRSPVVCIGNFPAPSCAFFPTPVTGFRPSSQRSSTSWPRISSPALTTTIGTLK